jgi:hypothetical protein
VEFAEIVRMWNHPARVDSSVSHFPNSDPEDQNAFGRSLITKKDAASSRDLRRNTKNNQLCGG